MTTPDPYKAVARQIASYLFRATIQPDSAIAVRLAYEFEYGKPSSMGWSQEAVEYRICEILEESNLAPKPTCQWTYDDIDGFWSSACDKVWQFTEGGPTENGICFCHGCGRAVEVAEPVNS